MPALKFLVADAASAILTITLMVGIGFWGGNSIQILQKDVKRIEHIGVVVLAVYRGTYNEDNGLDGVLMTHRTNFLAEFKRQSDGSWRT